MHGNIFKAYDIRGIYPGEINELDVYKTAVALCKFLEPANLVVGCDVRLSSPALKRAAIKGITDQGVKVIDVGEISTDMLYYAVGHYGYAGGLTITASHNPKEYNGYKVYDDKGCQLVPHLIDKVIAEINKIKDELTINVSLDEYQKTLS